MLLRKIGSGALRSNLSESIRYAREHGGAIITVGSQPVLVMLPISSEMEAVQIKRAADRIPTDEEGSK